MKKSAVIALLAALAVGMYSCSKSSDSTPATVSVVLPQTVHQYYADNTNNINEKATVGRVLFYDGHLSLNNAISCGSCHKQALAFADNVSLSTGYENRLTKRNSMPIQDLVASSGPHPFEKGMLTSAGGGSFLFWDGRENNVQNLIARPITNHVEMGISDMSVLPAKLSALPYYSKLFTDAYGTSEITKDKISECIAYFISSIKTGNSRYELSVIRKTVLTAQEQEGMLLFQNKFMCNSCHNSISFDTSSGGMNNGYTSMDFMDNGLDDSYTDMGQGTITGNATDNGKFKAPKLHNIALTAPYMHDGRYKTLDEVLEHYSHNIRNTPNLDIRLRDQANQPRNMNMTNDEKQAIIAFLNTLTDTKMITETSFSNPFRAN
ncbi:MAG: hypothetical protein H0X33_08960 [Taibaiella sp.]|nr:hypothetical protein [Taibaiella sp.]